MKINLDKIAKVLNIIGWIIIGIWYTMWVMLAILKICAWA